MTPEAAAVLFVSLGALLGALATWRPKPRAHKPPPRVEFHVDPSEFDRGRIALACPFCDQPFDVTTREEPRP